MPPRKRGNASATPATQRQRVRKHRRIEQRLDEDFPHGFRIEIAGHVGEIEAVRRGQRQYDVVLGRRGLKLEVELAAEALAQRQAPGAVDAAAIRRVDDQLHAAGFIEKALENQGISGGEDTKRPVRCVQILHHLLACGLVEPEIVLDPAQGGVGGLVAFKASLELGTKARDRQRKLIASARRLAKPKRNGRRRAMRVFHTHDAALDTHDAIGGIAELEDVAGQTLDGEVLVHGADDDAFRFEQHLEIGVVGNRAAGGQRREARAAPPAQNAIDLVTVQQSAAASATRAETFGQHAQHVGKGLACEITKWPCPPDQRKQSGFAPFPGIDLGRDLLSEHIEGLAGDNEPVQFAAIDAVDESGALNEVVGRKREKATLRLTANAVARAADTLHEARNRPRRPQLANQIDLADIDAELERGGRHHGAQVAILQPLLGIQPLFLGEASVMSSDADIAEAIGDFARHPFSHAPRVDENQRRAMGLDQLRQSIIDLVPDFRRHHRFERGGRNFELEVPLAIVPAVNDRAWLDCFAGNRRTDEETRHLFDGLLRGRQADPMQPVAAKRA